MSEVKRYGYLRYSDGHECTSLFGERADGDYVQIADYWTTSADYEALSSQLSALQAERDGLVRALRFCIDELAVVGRIKGVPCKAEVFALAALEGK